MRTTRHRLSVLVTALAGASVAFSSVAAPIVTPDAPPSCWLFRGAATPDDPSDDAEVCREDVWFADPGTKVGNAGSVTGFPTWDTTPPEASVTGGAGGGALGVSASHQTAQPWDDRSAMVAEGTVTGALDTLAVELYLFPVDAMAKGLDTFTIDAQLLVDGESVATVGGLVVPLEVAGDAARRLRFAWTDLADSIEDWGLALDGDHDVRLTVHGTGIASNAAVFVWDTTEVPAGMVVNIDPVDLDGVTTVSAY